MTTIVGSAITFRVNGRTVEYRGPGGRRLVDVLREDLGLTGVKEGCGEGECGSCSVLLDGKLVTSCLVPIGQVDGCEVRTVEGLAHDPAGAALQAAFLHSGAVQCGFCTPGMLLAGVAFLESGALATDEAVRSAIAGNLCRCTGYARIVEAIRAAADHGASVGRESVSPQGATESGRPAAAGAAEATEAATGARARVLHARSSARPSSAAPALASPSSLDEALQLFAAGPCRAVAGATDVMVERASRPEPRQLVDLSRVPELTGIGYEAGSLTIRALTTYSQLRRSPLVQEHVPVLAAAAAGVGAVQIQNRGTIGGNLATASPAGDLLPILLAIDATIDLASVRGERSVPIGSFFIGYRATALAGDELLVRVRVPLGPSREVRYRKVGTRRAQSIAKVAVAVSWRPDGGAMRDVRVAVGSVAELPMRCEHTERVLEGAPASRAVADEAARVLATEIRPIDDLRSTADYRRAVAANVLRRLLLDGATPAEPGVPHG